MKLKRKSAGHYLTQDGRYEVVQDYSENECECIHCQAGRDCPNGGWRLHWAWHIWDIHKDEYEPPGCPLWFDTLRDARAHLEAVYAEVAA